MLYSQEELPETVFMSLLTAPYAKKIFTKTYDRVLRQCDRAPEHLNYRERNEIAIAGAWRAVKEAYGLTVEY